MDAYKYSERDRILLEMLDPCFCGAPKTSLTIRPDIVNDYPSHLLVHIECSECKYSLFASYTIIVDGWARRQKARKQWAEEARVADTKDVKLKRGTDGRFASSGTKTKTQ